MPLSASSEASEGVDGRDRRAVVTGVTESYVSPMAKEASYCPNTINTYYYFLTKLHDLLSGVIVPFIFSSTMLFEDLG